MIIDDILKASKYIFRKDNDDFADRLHYLYSVIGLAIHLLIITSKQYLGEPIQCAINVNSEFNKYIHQICWINGTFTFEMKKENNKMKIDNDTFKKIDYYQWMVFIVLFECVIFIFPTLIWSLFVYLNGFSLQYVTSTVIKKSYLNEYVESRNFVQTQKTIESIGDHIRMTFLKHKAPFLKRLNFPKQKLLESKNLDNYQAQYRRDFPNLKIKPSFPLFVPYLIVKLIYLASLVLHFFFIGFVFRFNFWEFGINKLRSLFNNYTLQEYAKTKTGVFTTSPYFPTRSLCDVEYFAKTEYNLATFICSLPLNMFNEIFYFCFYFWMIFIGAVSVISIFYWCLLFSKSYRKKIVLKALQINSEQKLRSSYSAAFYFGDEVTNETADSFLIEKTGLTLMENFNLFFDDVCSVDVVFVIKLISINSNSLVKRDIFNELWDKYLDLEDLKIKDVKTRPYIQLKRPMIKPDSNYKQINETEN